MHDSKKLLTKKNQKQSLHFPLFKLIEDYPNGEVNGGEMIIAYSYGIQPRAIYASRITGFPDFSTPFFLERESRPLVQIDDEVDVLLQKIDITKLTDRDSQEVVGYFEVLDLISESYENINLTESHIKSLHNRLMKYSVKDEWHKGNYKVHNNAVEASFPDDTRQIIFQTTEAGFATEDAIRQLLNWYNSETEVHPLIKVASYIYDFLSVHPFQDGNGRLSR